MVKRTRATGLAMIAAICAVTVGVGDVQAKPTREALLKLLKRQPAKMAAGTWREQRREAARELGRMRERRAVPALLGIVRKERFDVILEIAIEALGKIGDKRAKGPLRELLRDPSLDSYVREAATNALKALEPGASTTPVESPQRPPSRVERPTSHALTKTQVPERPASPAGEFAELAPVALPNLSPDTLARSHQFDIVAGAGKLAWDGWSDTVNASAAVDTRYRLQHEQRDLGYTVDGALGLGFRLNDPRDSNASWMANAAGQINPEVRYYPTGKLTRGHSARVFGQLSAGLGYGLGLFSPPFALDNRVTASGTASIGGGPGYGRVIEAGPILLLRRWESALQRAGLLRSRLAGETARELLKIWYGYRNDVGSYRRLGYSLRLLEQRGLIAQPVDAATTYRLVRILEDPQLLHRRVGTMLRAGYGIGRNFVKDAADDTFGFAYATAEMIRQLGRRREVMAVGRFFWDHIGDRYNVSAEASHAWFLYNKTDDPLGAFKLSLSGGINSQPGGLIDNSGIGYQALLGATYARFFDRGTRVSANLRGGIDRRGFLVLFSIDVKYGLVQGAYIATRRRSAN